jgi:hypothetical protein
MVGMTPFSRLCASGASAAFLKSGPEAALAANSRRAPTPLAAHFNPLNRPFMHLNEIIAFRPVSAHFPTQVQHGPKPVNLHNTQHKLIKQ